MEKAREIGQILLWLAGHLAFTIIINLTALGGYYAYQQYQSIHPVQIDLSQLDQDARNELSKELFLLNQSENNLRKKG